MIAKVISFILMIFVLSSCSSKTSTETTDTIQQNAGVSSENAGANSVRLDTTPQATEVPSESVGGGFHATPKINTPTQTTDTIQQNAGANSVRPDTTPQATEVPSESVGGGFHATPKINTPTQTTDIIQQNVGANNVRPDTTQQEKHAIVKISIIDIDGNKILQQTEIKFKEGQTVYDALLAVTQANNIELETRGKGIFVYIESIGGIAEFDQGPLSGWVYWVNGQKPNKSAGAYKLKEDDEIVWKFTKDAL